MRQAFQGDRKVQSFGWSEGPPNREIGYMKEATKGQDRRVKGTLRTHGDSKPVVVTVYPIAGRQLFFRVPDAVCEECELAVRAVRRAVAGLGDPPQIQVRIRPWLTHLLDALLHAGWHPPVVTINGRRFSRGVVPDVRELQEALAKLIGWKEKAE